MIASAAHMLSSHRYRLAFLSLPMVVSAFAIGAYKPSTSSAQNAPASTAGKPAAMKSKPLVAAPPAASAQGRLRLVGGDFPNLVIDKNDNPKDENGFMIVKPGQVPCKRVRAKTVSEVGGAWSKAIASIQFTCKYGDDGLDTETTARLHKNAATMFGVPVIEVRLDVAERGYNRRYLLQGTMRQHAKALIAAIQARCRALALQSDCKMERTSDEEDSYMLIFSDDYPQGLFLEPDPEDPKRIVYAESPSDA